MKYIDLNMVRARVVTHPSEWKWCGYDELVGTRQRYRLLDLDSVLRWQDGVSREEFISVYQRAIEDSVRGRDLERQGVWTESIAIGSEEFVGRISEQVPNRIRLERSEISAGVWTVREGSVPYATDSRRPGT